VGFPKTLLRVIIIVIGSFVLVCGFFMGYWIEFSDYSNFTNRILGPLVVLLSMGFFGIMFYVNEVLKSG